MKFTRSLLAISLFSAAQMVAAQSEKPDAFVQQLLEKQYPHNEKALKTFNEHSADDERIKQCYFKEPKSPENNEPETSGYCMNFVGEKIVDTAQGKRRYIFFSGETVDTGHSLAGLDALFVFTSADGKDWTLLAHKEADAANGFGEATREIKWLETGAGLWGVMSEGGFTQGGVTEGSTQILFDDGKEIRRSNIATYYGVVNDCDDAEDLQAAEKSKADCYAEKVEIKATVEVRHDLPAVGNVYPLQLTVKGYDGLKLTGEGKNAKTQPIKEYKDKKFVFSYDADKHKFVAPADYSKIFGSDDT